MSRAVLIVVTSKDCPACVGLVKEKDTLEAEYKLRDDVELIFLHSDKKSLIQDLRNIHFGLQKLVRWTPFVILVTPESFKDRSGPTDPKYEIMNYTAITSKIQGRYQHTKNGIDQFVRDQLANNPLFSTTPPKGLVGKRSELMSHINESNSSNYSLDYISDISSSGGSKYRKDEL